MRLRRDQTVRWQQVPEGMRDLLPAEAERRSALLLALREEFRRWGYREVMTPTLEHLDTFLQGGGPGLADRLFKLVDSGGEILALRPEMTVPIARLAASRLLLDAPRPLRVSYVAPVFRGQEAGRGRRREFTQAGVELLGDATPDADAEVIALAAESLRRAGVARPAVRVGELGFLDDAMAGIPDDAREEIRGRLYRRDFAGIDQAVADPGLARLLRALPDLHGADAVGRALALVRSERGAAAVHRLADIQGRLEAYGVAEFVSVDLGIIRDFSYYTGVVFEAYDPGMGYPLLGGGRYDGLLARFGVDCPATGFALGVERVLSTAPPTGEAPADFLIVVDERTRAQGVRLAQELRALGKAVIVASESTAAGTESPFDGLRANGPFDGLRASGPGAARVIRLEGRSLRITGEEPAGEQVVDQGEFVHALSGRPRATSWTH